MDIVRQGGHDNEATVSLRTNRGTNGVHTEGCITVGELKGVPQTKRVELLSRWQIVIISFPKSGRIP